MLRTRAARTPLQSKHSVEHDSAVADATVGYGQFKRVASEAVRVADMRVVVSEERRTRQSTLAKYLQLIGPLPEGSMSPNEFRPYLAASRWPRCSAEVPAARW